MKFQLSWLRAHAWIQKHVAAVVGVVSVVHVRCVRMRV